MSRVFKANELTRNHIVNQMESGAKDMREEWYGSGEMTLNNVASLMVECYTRPEVWKAVSNA